MAYIQELRKRREAGKAIQKTAGHKRQSLSKSERQQVLSKTAGLCHICGGKVGERWHADHVLAHSGGGGHTADNYLPAHPTCNNYRWDYLPEEFELILKLGVWARTEIEKETKIGQICADKFLKHELKRIARRKPKS